MIKTDQDIDAGDYVLELTAGENLSARDACYISAADGKAYKCDADDATKQAFVGFAQEAATANGSVNLVHHGHFGGFSALTIGGSVYLSTTAGAVTQTAPTAVFRIGYAVSATIIKIETQRSTFPNTQVFSGSSPNNSMTDLDLSSVVGARQVMVMLRIENTDVTSASFTFRRNGDTATFGAYTSTDVFGVSKAFVASGNNVQYVICPTDSAGIVEWTGSASRSVTIRVESFW